MEKTRPPPVPHQGWCRELAIEALGLPAVLPPPEEVKNVETAIGASRAEQQRESHALTSMQPAGG